MESDMGLSLILGRPFLRDAKARIDLGTGNINSLIIGKNMKFRFQNKKKELLLVYEDNEEKGLCAEPGREDWEIHDPPTEPSWED